MSRPLMFIVAGVNGFGKSSFTRIITKKHPALKIIDPDAIGKGITGSFQNLKAHLKLCDLGYIFDNSKHYQLIASYRHA